MSVGVDIVGQHPALAAPHRVLLEIRIFGRLRIFDARTKREIHFRSRKALALLCYLAVATDHALTRERAMELLWGSRGEDQARASLRQILHEIRLSLGACDAIEFGRQHLSARPGAIDTDVDEMVRLAEGGDIAVLAGTSRGWGER